MVRRRDRPAGARGRAACRDRIGRRRDGRDPCRRRVVSLVAAGDALAPTRVDSGWRRKGRGALTSGRLCCLRGRFVPARFGRLVRERSERVWSFGGSGFGGGGWIVPLRF